MDKSEYETFETSAYEAASSGWDFDTYASIHRVSPSFRLRYNDLLQKYQSEKELKRRRDESECEYRKLERQAARAMGID